MVVKAKFDYGDYVHSVQDAEKLKKNLAAFVPFFSRCTRVLDLGCGSGYFLQLLQTAGIEAVGVDADEVTATRAESQGLNIVRVDVLEFVKTTNDRFDGIFCSHLVEHLPFPSLVELIEGISRCLNPDGTVVIAFPNPESLDMQLFHFWLDPQHVRLYHPTLIEAMLRHYELQITETRFRHWRMGGAWSSANGAGTGTGNGLARDRGVLRKVGRQLKQALGITRLEGEVDYLTRLRSVGEEAVIIARKAEGA